MVCVCCYFWPIGDVANWKRQQQLDKILDILLPTIHRRNQQSCFLKTLSCNTPAKLNQGGDTPYILARRFLSTPERRHVSFPCALSAIAAWRFSKELYNSSEKIIYSEVSIECNGPGLCCPYTQTQWQSAICKRDSSWISNVKGPEPVLPVPAMGATKSMWERIIH